MDSDTGERANGGYQISCFMRVWKNENENAWDRGTMGELIGEATGRQHWSMERMDQKELLARREPSFWIASSSCLKIAKAIINLTAVKSKDRWWDSRRRRTRTGSTI